MTTANLIEIFCILDKFCKFFAPELKKHTIQVLGKRHRNRPSRMSDSEIMTILIYYCPLNMFLCRIIRFLAKDKPPLKR